MTVYIERKWITASIAALAGATLLIVAHGASAPRQPVSRETLAANVDGDRIVGADKEPGQWLSVGRTYDEQRFSPLDQITTANVKDLGLAWYADLGSTRGVEASPLFIDGVIYNILPWNITEAYDARTGKRLWRYDPKVPLQHARLACCGIVARGLAAWKGKIIFPTLDGRLIALNARTGAKIWETQTLDDEGPIKWPWTVTGSPRVFDGKVLIGNSGAETGAPGWLSAYDAESGKKLWRFHVIPPDPSKGPMTQAQAMAAATWTGEWWKIGGGGTPWDSIVYDPKAKLVYVGTGNGGPWVRDHRSPGGGDNLFLASIVALRVENGEYVWHYQQTPGDHWDYTSTQPIILADLTIDGRVRQVAMHAPKNGFFYVLDRITGELISAEPYVDGITWATGIDKKTGRPIEVEGARYGEKPVLVSPGPGGAHNWHPMAYNPLTGLVYFPAVETAAIFAKDPKFVMEPGAIGQMGTATTGYDEERKVLLARIASQTKAYLLAYDPVNQKQVWRAPYPRSGSGGVLTTAGNLVFQGTIGSTFAAYNATTGEKAWEMPAQQVPVAAPISFMLDGAQYIAVNAGYGGGINHGPVTDDTQLQITDYGRLLVYKLGGKVQLPKVVFVKSSIDPPPNIRGSALEVMKGSEIFAKQCAGCHGDSARGGIKDLRRMSKETHAEFFDIVLGGKRGDKGMASFADILSREDAELIQKYLIARINEDWTELKNAK